MTRGKGVTTVAKRRTKEASTSTARRLTVVEEASTSHTTDDSDYDAELENRRNTGEPSTSQEDLHTQRRPRQKRKRQPSTQVIEATDTKGQLAVESQSVLATLRANRTQVPNVNCRVDHTGHLIASLSGRKREIVEEMGFSSLIYLNERVLPRELCYWLMTRVDPDTGVLFTTDGREFLLAPVHVHCILGIPRGDKVVPETFISPDHKRIERVLWEDFGATVDGKKQISMDKAHHVLKEGGGELDETRFRRALLIAILGSFLCPTTNFASLAVELLPALITIEDDCSSYDWCTYVLSWLLRRVKTFNLKFQRHGYVAGCGGCTYFLALFYLDRLNRLPTSWGVFPRVKAWTHGALKLVVKEDRDGEDGDYGNSTTLDVAYGESHPKAPRDFYPPSHSGGLDDEVMITAVLKRVVKEAMREVMAEERGATGLTSSLRNSERPPSTPSSTHRSLTPSQVRWSEFVSTFHTSAASGQDQEPSPVRGQACSEGEQLAASLPTSSTHGSARVVSDDQGEAQLEQLDIPLDTPLVNLLPPRDHMFGEERVQDALQCEACNKIIRRYCPGI